MKFAALALVAGLLAVASPSAGSPAGVLRLRPSSSVAVPHLYDGLVADAGRVAVVGSPCGIGLWRPGKPTPSFIRACRSTPRDWGSGIDGVALAGQRLAWIREESVSHGSRVQTDLVVKAGSGKPRVIASGYIDLFANVGTQLFSLRGAGSTLAFGWESHTTDPNGVVDTDERVYRLARAASEPGTDTCPGQNDLVSNPPPARLCTNTGHYVSTVESVSQGRLLVSSGNNDAAIVEPDNKAHNLSIPFRWEIDDLALSGTNVIVVRADSTTVEIYDAESGTRLHRWPIARASSLKGLSVDSRFAVFEARGFHLVRLSDGSEKTLLAPGGTRPIDVALDSSGLFVLYRTHGRTRLGFVPLARL